MGPQKNKSSGDARIRRATELSSTYPFAAEVLRFYAQVAMLQQSLYSELEQTPAHVFFPASSGWGELNIFKLLPKFGNFLSSIGQVAPTTLSQAAIALSQKPSSSWQPLLEDFWHSRAIHVDDVDVDMTNGKTLADQCLAWLFLQPCAEYLAGGMQGHVPDEGSPRTCPLCNAKPIVGVLRPEGDGARKSLICMFCAHEWAFRRLYCPSCGEEREPHLAFYSAPEVPHVRVDVCDTCRTYLKTVDLTKTGLAVPVVDELAAIPLDLWARENNYRKLQMNAVGI
jgi:FdhE protein